MTKTERRVKWKRRLIYIPRLLAAGVTSLKIEGRLKSPEYVASVTQHYRAAIDATLADRFIQLSDAQAEEMELDFLSLLGVNL